MASKRGMRRRAQKKSCEGKVQHPTMDGALIAKRRGGPSYAQTWAYRCKFCTKWHLGHPGQTQLNGQRAKWRKEN